MRNPLAAVQHGQLVLPNDQMGVANPIEVGSREWFTWLETADAFSIDEQGVPFIAHRMHYGESAVWLAFCAIEHEVRWVVLGSALELTRTKLQSATYQFARRGGTLREFPMSLSSEGGPLAHLPASSPDLLVTKLELPIIQTTRLVRTRAVDRLAHALDYPLTVISAPSGYGKSTVLAQWLGETNAQVAWVVLDENDNDSVRFCTYVLAALDRIVPGTLAAGMQFVQNTHASLSDASLLARLINSLAVTAGEIVLVLDDYHTLRQDNDAIHEAILYFVEHIPATVHVILATRTTVPVRIAKLRMQRRMLELRIDDLRFTREEAQAFLERGTGELLPSTASGRIQARTEGWVAGLQLAVLALEEHPAAAADSLVDIMGEHRYVVDFLADEVLRRLSPEVRERVLWIAALNRFNAALCDELLGVTDSQATLETLERENAFLVPLDDFRGWYRFHGLFAELLRKRLHQTHPNEIRELYRRASAWHELHGAAHEAVRYALLAGDEDVAVHMVQDAAKRLSEAETSLDELWDSLERCLDALTAPVVRKHPRLCLTQAEVLLHSGHIDESEQWLGESFALVSQLQSGDDGAVSRDDYKHLEDEIMALRNIIAQVRQDFAAQGGGRRAAVTQPLLPYPATGNLTSAEQVTSEQAREFGDSVVGNREYETKSRIEGLKRRSSTHRAN